MAKVSLRIYNRDIEALVEQEQIPEAIAHCQHILKTFPKHLETYRLLGKAYLEARRYGDAADIFQRVLMSVPDDFVSHVGMSIIRDDENNLDEAIWHMERAFEAQPSNAAVQGELRRLYGRRDGMEPPKIRMTRGALAHMYLQGQLFAQAIAEIRTVLAEEPQRVDMQTLLAKAYFFAGQRIEATELCTTLMKKYPYSLDANRIMVEILPGTERADSTQVFRHKVNQLEPYAAFATSSLFELASVADAAVSLDRLEYEPGQDELLGAGWASSLGINLESDQKEEATPDWLSAAAVDVPESAEEMAVQTPEEDIPDFMRAAGWKSSSGEFQDGPVNFDDEEDDSGGELAPADIPDWLQGMAPDEPESEPETSQADLDFLSTAAAPVAAAAAGEVPDWLKNAAPAEEPSTAEVEAPAVETPDWMNFGEETQETPAAATSEQADLGEIPDWLGDLGGEEGKDETPAEIPADFFAAEPEPEPEVAPVEPAPAAPPAGIGDLGTSAEDQDSALAWLESLAAKQGAKEEELIVDPAARRESAPEWVEKAQVAAGESQAPQASEELFIPEPEPIEEPVDEEGLAEADIPSWLDDMAGIEQPVSEEPVVPESFATGPDFESEPEVAPTAPTPVAPPAGIGDLGTSAEDQDSALAWLESLAAKQGAKEEELIVDPAARRESAPEWVEKAQVVASESQSVQAVEEPASFEPEPEPEMPVFETRVSQEQPPIEAMPERVAQTPISEPEQVEQAPAIEESLFEEDAELSFDWAETPEAAAPESIDSSGVTSWLQNLDGEEQPAEKEVPAFAPVEQTPELPSWLSESKQQAASGLSDDDLPDWLRDEEPGISEPEVVAEQLVPTIPTEWQPAEDELLAEVLPEAIKPETIVAEQAPEPVMEIPQPEPEPEPESSVEPVQEEQPPAGISASTPIPTMRRTGMLNAKPQDEALLQAQTELQRGNLQVALDVYSQMIKKNRLLDEVIYDLRDATYRYPVDVTIWQMLGDAYMRANRLQDALDAYTKAEELLR